MSETEIKIDSEEIQESIGRLKEISVRLGFCKSQELLIDESSGKTAEQVKTMYNELLLVEGAMKELVEQTVELVDNGKKAFKEADEDLANMYRG